MRINATGSGNIGIGLVNPVQKLDVNGNINLAKVFHIFVENHRVLRIDSINGNIFLGMAGVFNNTATAFYNTITGYQGICK